MAVVGILFLILRILRKLDYKPKYIPGKYLKRRWENWRPGISYGYVPNRQGSPVRQDTSYQGAATSPAQTRASNSNVRRDTSVRSIVTLPSYSLSPKPEEQVIAREGEREGMDVVVEFPETAAEEEDRREEHMEALYQVRLQRRQENELREARRRERREALARGDYDLLERLRREHARDGHRRSSSNNSVGNDNNNGNNDNNNDNGNGNNNNNNSENRNNLTSAQATRVALQRSRERQKKISSVSYAALGYVRHDGSRVRANSAESDRNPLLHNVETASMDGRGSIRPGTSGEHTRGDSISSLSTGGSDGENLIPVTSNASLTRAPTGADDEAADVASLRIPPPDYNHLDWGDAPAYGEQGNPEQRESLLRTVPTIHIDVIGSDDGDDPTSEATEVQPASAAPDQHPAENRSAQSQDSQPVSTDQGETAEPAVSREQANPQLPPLTPQSPIEFDVLNSAGTTAADSPRSPSPNEQNASSSTNSTQQS